MDLHSSALHVLDPIHLGLLLPLQLLDSPTLLVLYLLHIGCLLLHYPVYSEVESVVK